MRLHRALLLLPATRALAAADDDPETPLPLIIWHGLGDSYKGDGMQQIGRLADSVHPGTWVVHARVDDDDSADRSAGFWGNVTEQVAKVCGDLRADPIVSTAPAVDLLGFSQGGLFARALAEQCCARPGPGGEGGVPRARSLVTFGSPHNGIVDFKACGASDWLCRGAMALLKSNTWGAWAQSRLVPAQYYRDADPERPGMPSEGYLAHSNFLADLNNERAEKRAEYARSLGGASDFAMYVFEEDETVIPKESAWFADVDTREGGDGNVTLLRERALYREDWLGLKRIDARGGLHFRKAPGRHMQLSDEVLVDAMETYFGPLNRKGKQGGRKSRLDL
jgi:palmitoyl-protein thioesterase